ncbi:hypothetical protein JTB14_024996 [Gonioctena quinquepunctata]|nr:hypothetical protein JTB14_024996 [Gonioctena quinquepunctata]
MHSNPVGYGFGNQPTAQSNSPICSYGISASETGEIITLLLILDGMHWEFCMVGKRTNEGILFPRSEHVRKFGGHAPVQSNFAVEYSRVSSYRSEDIFDTP